jgi:hypothetical protein
MKTVYILETGGSEYRVTASISENILNSYEDFDVETKRWSMNRDVVTDLFGQSPVFTNIDQAREYAIGMSDAAEEIVHMTAFAEQAFPV